MPILEENIQFVESQVMDDVPEGGGAATGRVVGDAVNNLFDDISDLDRALGRFNLRKIFVAVRTLSAELFGGAKSVITALPQDNAIGYALFSTGDPFDTRQAAINRVESYLFKGPIYGGYLLENHIAGMKAISITQKVDSVLPAAGQTLCIVQDEGEPTEKEQYVRVTRVDYVEAEYEDNRGVYTRWVVTCGLSDALLHDFTGHEVRRDDFDFTYNGRARLRSTLVADATKYYGGQPLAQPAFLGDGAVRAASAFAQLVPSAQTESAVTDASMGLTRNYVRPASSAEITESATVFVGNASSPASMRVSRPIAPGSALVNASTFSTVWRDNGDGTATRIQGAHGSELIPIDYENGIVSGIYYGSTVTWGSANINVSYTPGVAFAGKKQSMGYPVTQTNRSYNYNYAFPQAKPRPGTTVVSYRALGNWYSIADRGDGLMDGSGTGSVSFTTGTISVTLNALPDNDTTIIVEFVANVDTELAVHEGSFPSMLPAVEMNLTPTVAPGSLTITYTAGGTPRTVTDDGTGGLAGDGTGTIDYGQGKVTLTPSLLHDDGTTFDATYSQISALETDAAQPWAGGILTDTLPNAPIAPGSVSIRGTRTGDAAASDQHHGTKQYLIRDDGAGNLIGDAGETGTINYTTGAYTVSEGGFTTTHTRAENVYVGSA